MITEHPFWNYYTENMKIAAVNPPSGFNAFTSDGASGPAVVHGVFCFFNPGFEEALNAESVKHDFAYWKGGTEAERLAADERFRAGLSRWPRLAEIYFKAVRAGGKPGTGKSYAWGYGKQ